MAVVEYKRPVCTKCGKTLKGFVPVLVEVICFLCDNPNISDEEADEEAGIVWTYFKDRR